MLRINDWIAVYCCIVIVLYWSSQIRRAALRLALPSKVPTVFEAVLQAAFTFMPSVFSLFIFAELLL